MKLPFFQCFILLLTLCFFGVSNVDAKQLNFATQTREADVTFNYVFEDYQFRKQRLSFTLAQDALKNSSTYLKPNGNFMINSYITKDIKAYLEDLNDDRIHYSLQEKGNGFNLKLSGKNITQDEMNAVKDRIEKIKRSSTDKYFHDYYVMPHPDDENLLMPDYYRLTKDNTKLLSPVSREIANSLAGSSQRDKINYTLNFLQSIPYDNLESIEPPKGLGYMPPGALFMLNKGDCESKTIAAASIYKTLSPNVKMVAVVITKHVLLGLNIPRQLDDEVLSINGTDYVLTEPTGSNILAAGQIFPDSKNQIKRKNYIVIPL